MRGLGTIRQDLNVSIPKGALIEIKGVQELELISKAVEYEVQRQLNLLSLKEDLQNKGITAKDLKKEIIDVTQVFKQTNSKVIRKALDRNQCVKAVKLFKFRGFLKRELVPNYRLGSEMADRARFWGRVGGIFHTDEMPAYGITLEEIEALRKAVDAEEEDGVVFVADRAENVADALRAVIERAQEAIEGVPAETRGANADGTTKYMRPRPGSARMYPETDIPPTLLTEELIQEVRSNLPEPFEKRIARLKRQYGLNEKLSRQIADSEFNELFENIVTQSKVASTTVAAFLTETLKALSREGIEIEKVSSDQMTEIFRRVGSGELSKEAAPDLFAWLSKQEGKTVQDGVSSLCLQLLSEEKLERTIDDIIAKNEQSVDKLGEKAFGMLMGIVMREVRGKANPEAVAKILRRKLQ
jgi:glutamyl-tRNA(Gln) amidotransferase subunit E